MGTWGRAYKLVCARSRFEASVSLTTVTVRVRHDFQPRESATDRCWAFRMKVQRDETNLSFCNRMSYRIFIFNMFTPRRNSLLYITGSDRVQSSGMECDGAPIVRGTRAQSQ